MFQELHTDRLLLRKVSDNDLPFVHQGLSNEDLTRYMLIHYPSLEDAKVQMAYYEEQYRTENGCYWVMELTDAKVPVGIIGITNITTVHRRAELGYWVLPEWQGKGLVVEAAKKIIAFCFNVLQLNRIEADAETGNTRSIRLLEKLKFSKEGVFQEYEINKGQFIDLARYALIKKNWTDQTHP